MKVFQAEALDGQETQGGREVLFAHRGEEIGEGLMPASGMGRAPLHKQTDHQPAQHAQHPQRTGRADATQVLQQRSVQPGVQPRLDVPRLAVALQPDGGVELAGLHVGEERHGFVGATRRLAFHPGGLCPQHARDGPDEPLCGQPGATLAVAQRRRCAKTCGRRPHGKFSRNAGACLGAHLGGVETGDGGEAMRVNGPRRAGCGKTARPVR